ncbi:MAG: MBL fold metallo-hydrolase, partial [Pseudolabrys sp.]|nr:MBL fold metallo-hydrolase [Pseudolabrys sp.]
AMLADVARRKLKIEWLLDSHPHADHLSALDYLKGKLGAPTATGAKIVEVQKLWRDIYNAPDLPTDGSDFDKLFTDGESFNVGEIAVRVMHTPGHTLASVIFIAGDAAFVNDTLFQPDTGSARCDFPGGSPQAQYDSIMKILALPDDTRLFTGHDYKHGGRAAKWESTVAAQKRANVHFGKQPTREQYAEVRRARDRTLPMPRNILHALQINLRAGKLPPPESDGRSYLKIPLNRL